ncbi:MAG: hypothetical protein ABIN57_09935 [Chitinophagaceae bacterium]
MTNKQLLILFAFLVSTSFFSCKSEIEKYQTDATTEYLPLIPGKYITYRLDSTVYPNAGRSTEVHSYQEKNMVDSIVKDNLGRPGYRVFRYLRDTAGLQYWTSAGSYLVIPTNNTVEVLDNNQRIISLIAPVKEGLTWKGNRYLADDPYKSIYTFQSVDNNDLSDWTFTYKSIATETIGGKSYNDVLTVSQQDEMQNVANDKPAIASAFASRTLAVDKYAKNIGLVFQQRIMWEYQPNLTGPSPYKTGFGVKRTMIDHN